MFVVSHLNALWDTWVVKWLYLELQMHHFDCQPWWSPPNYPDNTKSSQGTCSRHQYWQLGVKITKSQSSTCSLKTSWMCTAHWGASFSCIIIISLCGSKFSACSFSFIPELLWFYPFMRVVIASPAIITDIEHAASLSWYMQSKPV